MIYLDNAATSPIDEEVYEAMIPYLREEYGNPSSKYYCTAIHAKNAVEEARCSVASLIEAKPEEIIFTAGATESTNYVIKGYLDYNKYYGDGRSTVITDMAEHQATINVCKFLNGEIFSNNDPSTNLKNEKKIINRGFAARFLEVNTDGTVSPTVFAENITDDAVLSSFAYVNNEIGSINNIVELSAISHSHSMKLHSDITQAVGKIEINVAALGLDFASFSAHKLYGPKGIGAVYIKCDSYGAPPLMTSLLHGGEQEMGLRAGTLAVHNIVGFGKAAQIAKKQLIKNAEAISSLDDYFITRLKKFDYIRLINTSENRLKGIISIAIQKDNFNNERFIKKISDRFAISTGSACSLGTPSHVISAIGLSDIISKVLRISINKYTNEKDIDDFIKCLDIVK